MKRDSYLVGKAFRSFLFASVMTVAASQMGAFIDGLMVTWFISDTAMSAINIAMPVLQLYFSLCLLLGVGGTILAGKAIGSHDRDLASRIFAISVSTAVITGLVLGTVGLIFFNPILGLLCPDTIDHRIRQGIHDNHHSVGRGLYADDRAAVICGAGRRA